jgi:hypothetical protein
MRAPSKDPADLHHAWADFHDLAKTTAKLVRLFRRLSLDPDEGEKFISLVDELLRLAAMAEQRAEYYRPRSERERRVSDLWDAWLAEGRKISVSAHGRFARHLSKQLNIGRETAKRLIKAEKRRRPLVAAVFAGQGGLVAHLHLLKAGHER